MNKLILYAEDDRDTADLYINDFRDNGYDVIWAKDGQDAIDKYKKHSPDIVLLDIEMPVLRGFQVAEEIRRKDPYTPIIFLTSLTKSKDASKGMNLGADDYIRKDVETDELMARIERAIRRYPVKQNPVIEITSDTILDAANCKLNSCGSSYEISFRDCNLLRILVLNKNMPQKRDLLISQVWGNIINGKDYISKSISNLRKLMAEDKRIRIVSYRGDSVVLMIS